MLTRECADVLIVDAKSDLNVYWQTEGAEDGAGVNACCGPSTAAPKPAACCGPSSTEPKKEAKASSCCGPSSTEPKESKASSCCGPSTNGETKTNGEAKAKTNGGPVNQDGSHVDFNEYAGSYKIYAIKP